MTQDQKQAVRDAAERFIEGLWFKGGARLAMWLVTIIGAPLVILVVTWTHDFVLANDRRFEELAARLEAQSRELSAQTAKIEAHLQVVDLMMANDRKAVGDRDGQLNTRIDIVSGRVTETQRDYARINDVKAALDLRDQKLDGLDRRLTTIETRIYGPAAR